MLRKILFFLILASIFAFTVNLCLGLTNMRNFEQCLKESVRSFNGVACVNRLARVDSAGAMEIDGDGANWTFMVYLDGDNNLEEDCIDMFLDMSSVGSTPQVNIVVQMDRRPGYDDRYGNWTDCKRFNVTKDLTPTPENAAESLGEVNMGDPDTLSDFVNWTMNSFPASRYCLVLSDHGSGSVGSVCFDDTSRSDALTLPDLSQALSVVPKKIDVLYFDACLMGMVEVAYQIKDYVDVMVASEEVAWTGQPYDHYLSNLAANPSMSPSELADVIVSNYIEYTTAISCLSTMSGVNLSRILALKTATDNLAQRLNNSESIYSDEIRRARGQAEGYMGPYLGMYGWYTDLYHFAQLIYQYIPDSAIQNDASQVMMLLSNAVITEGHYSHPNSHGLSIFFPCKKDIHYEDFMNEYSTADFAKDTMWDEFICYHVSITPAKPDFVVVDVYWKPSNPMPGDGVTLYADLANQGTQDADVSIGAYVDGSSLQNYTLPFPAGYLDTIPFISQWTATKGNHSVTVIMDEDNFCDEWNETNNEMTKKFIVGYVLNVQTPYDRITVMIDGSLYYTDPNGNFQTYAGPGSHSLEVQTPVSLETGSRGAFVRWSDGSSSNPRTIFMNNNLSLTAEYVTQYYLTVNRNPSYIGVTTGEGWYNNGTIATATCTSPVPWGANTRYVFTNWTGDAFETSTTLHLIMDGPKTVTANYKTQFYINITSSHGVPTPSQWADKGSSLTVEVESPTETITNQTRWRCTGFSVDHVDVQEGTSYKFSYVQEPHEIEFYWMQQFWLQVDTGLSGSTVWGTDWYDDGTAAFILVDTPYIETWEHRFIFVSWVSAGTNVASITNSTSPETTVTMNNYYTVKATWQEQFYIIITSSHGDQPPSQWANFTESLYVNVISPADDNGKGTRYRCAGYRIDSGELQARTSHIFTNIHDSHTISFEWRVQYRLTINNMGHGTIKPAAEGWYDKDTLVMVSVGSDTTSNTTDTRYIFAGWSGSGLGNYTGAMNPCEVRMYGPVTEVTDWTTQYYLAINSPHGTTVGGDWYDDDSTAYAGLDEEIVSGDAGVRYVFVEWCGDASGNEFNKSNSIFMDNPKTATASWKTQYYLTVETDPPSLSPEPSVSPSGLWYDENMSVTLEAGDVSGYTFDCWDVDGERQGSGVKSITVEMNKSRVAIAKYKLSKFPTEWAIIIGIIVISVVIGVVAFVLKRRK